MKLFATILLVSAIFAGSSAKIYQECELAVDLVNVGFSRESLKDWVCLIKSESSMNTLAMNPTNSDGSRDWGLFQINDRYWCKGSGPTKNVCGFNCNSLMVDSIPSFEAKCVQRIFRESGGFSAWEGWKSKCRGRSLPSLDHCFKMYDTHESYEYFGNFAEY